MSVCRYWLVVFGIAIFTLLACNNIDKNTNTATPTLTSLRAEASEPEAYPYPLPTKPVKSFSGYPGPQFTTPHVNRGWSSSGFNGPLAIPEPAHDYGIVHGTLVVKTSQTSKVYTMGDIYLAPLIYSEGSVSIPFMRLDIKKDPKADMRTNEGEFAFIDVPPGEYGLIIHGPVSDYIIPGEGDGFLIINVKPGDVIDLGLIEIE